MLPITPSPYNGWERRIQTFGMQESKSCALPLGYPPIMAVCTGFEPVISRVTGERDNHYTNKPNGWDRGTRTRDISVNSRTLYRLSYIPILMVTPSGFEPEDVRVKGVCVNRFTMAPNKWSKQRGSNSYLSLGKAA